VSSCALHPETPAVGSCDYCARPHCEACLTPLLGRRYCPACVGPVQAVMEGRAVRVEVPVPGSAPPPQAFSLPGQTPPRMSGWASGLLYLVGFLLLVQVGAAVILILPLEFAQLAATGFRMPPSESFDEWLMNPSTIGTPLWTTLFGVYAWGMLGTTLLYSWGIVRWIERGSLRDLGLRWSPAIPLHLLLGLVLAGALFVSVVGTGGHYGWYRIGEARSGAEAAAIVIGGFALLLPLAAVEEIAMRGYLLPALGRSWGRAAGVIGSTVAFAALHSFNPGMAEHPMAVVGLLLAGLYLASAYLITGDLWLAIFLHTGWNLMEGPIFGLPVSGMKPPVSVFQTTAEGPTLWTGGSFGPEAGLLLCLMMVIHVAALWAVRPLLQRKSASR